MLDKRTLSAIAILLLTTTLCLAAKACPSDSARLAKQVKMEGVASAAPGSRTFSQLELPAQVSDPIFIPEQTFADSTQYYRSKALEYQQEVTRRNALVGNLNDLAALELPVGLASPGKDPNYAVIITDIRGDATGASLEAYFLFELPQTGDKIAFRGRNIRFSYNGALTGTGRMELIGSYPVKMNDKTLLMIKGEGNTYVDFDCGGFKGMGIEAEIEFSRDFIIPEDANGKLKPAPERVKTRFLTQVQSWNDILLGVTFPTFQVNGLKDISFTVHQAFLDWSDLANPAGMIFPPGYNSAFDASQNTVLWHGFHLQRLDVKLPSSFSTKQGTGRITLGVENMILDELGFSGTLFAENVLTAGDMSGWAYSIDRVGLELVLNHVKGFELAGKVTIPKIKSNDGKSSTQFAYLAHRGADGNFIFAVRVEDKVKLPLLFADLNLLPGSGVLVKEREGKFYPTATLHGNLNIKSVAKGVTANFSRIAFEGLVISSEDPRFDIQTLGFGGGEEQSVSKYPVVISNISVRKEGKERLGLGFDLTINLGGKSSDEGFGGTAGLIVWGKQNDVQVKDSEGKVIATDKENWEFDKIELGSVGIDIKKPNTYELKGNIMFFDKDPVYGDGFKGTLKGSISKFGGIEATALFGKTESFRYWYADALVKLKTGVPLVPGALFATGFGGGFYSKMKQTDKRPASGIGETKSGIYYVPDANTVGIKAIMMIGTARPEAMNGDVGLEVVLNQHGGINSVTLTGNANFMSLAELAESKMKELASSAATGKLTEKLAGLLKGQVYGSMRMHFDNVNDVFHGNLEIYVNVAGGLVRGISDGNKAGWAVLHFEKTDWYVLIGTPDQPLGLQVAKIFKSKSYFMLGKNLPGSPPPPEQVTEILGRDIDLDYMRDLNALQSGTGFAFGLHFIVDTGDVGFLMFYGRFAAGTGVDFMLKDYGKNCVCEGSSGPIGIDGWFANGQAYAFVQGKIGIRVKLKFIRGKFDILSIGAAAILQAKGPNPFWMKGIVGGYYNILGGLVKGDCRFEVTVGQDCKIVRPQEEVNPLEDIEIIAALTPTGGDTEVDVFTAPQAAFNMPIGEVFTISDEIEGRRLFRGNVIYFKVLSDGHDVKGTLRWNETNDVLAFDAFDVLPPQQELRLMVKVVFEEFTNQQWKTIYFEGKPIEEAKEITFTTGEAPDFIPPSNVDISYPAVGQFNFYAKEYNEGFIQLKKGQDYLFKPGEDWIQKMHFTDAVTEAYLETNITYNESERRVYFTIPPGLQTAKAYRMEILNFPRENKTLDANVKSVEARIASNAGDFKVTTKNLEGSLELRDIRSIYGSLFKTSSFNTFKEKVSVISLSKTFREDVSLNVFQLMAYLRAGELFDYAEAGTNFADRQIQFEAILNPNDWFQKSVYPLVYEGYPLQGSMTIRYRDINKLGIPPSKSLFVDQGGYFPVLTEENLSNTFSPPSPYNSIQYDVMVPAFSDYLDIQNQVANYAVSKGMNIPSRFTTLLTTTFPVYTVGEYNVRVNYVIPRINKTTSSHEWQLFNEIGGN